MRSINIRSGTRLAFRFIYVWVSAAMMALACSSAIAPSAFAQDANEDKISHNDISGTLEGTQDKREGRPDSDEVSDAIADGLSGIIDDGRANEDDRALLEGIGNSTREGDSEAVSRIFDKIGRGRIDDMVDNDALMKSIQDISPQAYDWLNQYGRPLADRYGMTNGTTQDIINSVISNSTFGGSDLSMQGGHTYSDLLASVVFSLSVDQKNASANQLEMPTLKSYPGTNDETETYGQLLPPEGDTGKGGEGQKLAAFIEGVFKYDWIVPASEDNHAEQVEGVSSLAMKFGSWGAAVYDAVTGVIRFSSEAFSNLNIVNLFGLGTGGEDGEENMITRFVANTLENMGISGSLTAIRVTAATVIGIAFLYVAMSMLGSARIGQMYNTTGARRMRGIGTRLVIIVIAVPFAVVFTSTIDNITRDFTKDKFGSAAGVNNQYVVDTLQWAAGSNLAMDGIGSTDVESFSPESQSVSAVMNNAQQKLNAAGVTNKDSNSTKAADLMGAFSEGKTASVDDYFAMISSAKNDGTSIAAANSPINTSRGAPIKNGNFKELGGNYFAPYFLSMRGDDLDSDSSSSSDDDSSSDKDDKKDKDKDKDDKDKDKDAEKDDKDKDAEKDEKKEEQADSSESNSQGDDGNVRGSITFSGSRNGERFECGNGKMICQRVKWNRPATYIYGAAAGRGASAEQSSIANYIASAGTHQNFDPATGEEASSAEKQRILNANATNIALANRYSGMESTVGSKSLSTQSVAILLQSRFENGALNYRALNASSTAAGSTIYGAFGRGTSFQRYVIPNTGKADLSVRVGSLVAMWMTAPIIAIVALFALFRAPILLAIVNMFKGFFQGLVFGNIGGLFKYALYYLALRMSFVFATAAIVAGIQFVDMINNILPTSKVVGATGSIVEHKDTEGGVFGSGHGTGVTDKMNEIWNSFGDMVNSAAQGVVLIVLTLVLCFVVVAPLFTMNTSNRGPHKVSLVTLIVTLPYILADVASAWIDGLVRNMFGMSSTQSKSVTGADRNNIGFKARNPKEVGKDAVDTVKDGAGMVKDGAGIVAGGMGAAAGYAASKAAGALAQTPAEEGLAAAAEKERVGAGPDGEGSLSDGENEFLTDDNGKLIKDENGEPIPIDPETGKPLDENVRDENGNPIDPETGKPIDPETGLPIDPETGAPREGEVQLDENGNPINARLDENGNPIEVNGDVNSDDNIDDATAAAAGAAAANALKDKNGETGSIDADGVESDEIRAGNANVGEQQVDDVRSDNQDVDHAQVASQDNQSAEVRDQDVDGQSVGDADTNKQDVKETHSERVVENTPEADRSLPSDREGAVDNSAVAAMGGAAAAAAAQRAGSRNANVDKLEARANNANVDSNDAKIAGNVDAKGDVESRGKTKQDVADRLKSGGGKGRQQVRATLDNAKQAFADPRAAAEAAARKVSDANANKRMMSRQDASKIASAIGGAVAGSNANNAREIRNAMREASDRMNGREVRINQPRNNGSSRPSGSSKPDQSTVNAMVEALKKSGLTNNNSNGGASRDSSITDRQIDEMRELNHNLRNANRK